MNLCLRQDAELIAISTNIMSGTRGRAHSQDRRKEGEPIPRRGQQGVEQDRREAAHARHGEIEVSLPPPQLGVEGMAVI